MSAAHCMHRVTLLAQFDQHLQSSAFTQPSFAVPVHRLCIRKVRHPLQRSNLEAGAVAQVSLSLIHMRLYLNVRCRLGAFGFATDTTGLMKEMEGASNYLKALKATNNLAK